VALLKPIEHGRMYPGWWRWNPIGGCEHDCSYCSIKRIQKRAPATDMVSPVFREYYLKDNLGSGRKIFCCSSGDAWGQWVDGEWIWNMIGHCREYKDNEYMFLTKNPARYTVCQELSSIKCIVGATIETDINEVGSSVGDAPAVRDRLRALGYVKLLFRHTDHIRTMVSLEPVMKFSSDFAVLLQFINPDIVYVGVDSGNNDLPEPTAEELAGLISELETFTDVRLKRGIERILGGSAGI